MTPEIEEQANTYSRRQDLGHRPQVESSILRNTW
jgi:hypothetical protein